MKFQRRATYVLCFALFITPVSIHADLIFPGRLDTPAFRAKLKSPQSSGLRAAKAEGIRYAAKKNLPKPQAHYELAKVIAQSPNASNRAWELVSHLELALQGGYQTATCHASLGQIYLAAGHFQSAEKHFSKVANSSPLLRFSWARTLVAVGNPAEALKQGQQTERELHQLMISQPAGSAAEIQWLAAIEFLEEYQKGITFLEQRLKNGAGVYAKKAKSQLYISWSDQLMRERKTPDKAAIQKLLLSLQTERENRPAMERFIKWIQQSNAVASAKKSVLIETLHDAKLSAHEHLVFGSALFQTGFVDEGVFHLQKAYAIAPTNPAVLNNLVWFLAHQKPPKLTRSLELANQLVTLYPEKKEFCETRGQIHYLRKDWEKARLDLEIAETVMPDHPGLHKALAEIYFELSLPEKSRVHRYKLEQLLE